MNISFLNVAFHSEFDKNPNERNMRHEGREVTFGSAVELTEELHWNSLELL